MERNPHVQCDLSVTNTYQGSYRYEVVHKKNQKCSSQNVNLQKFQIHEINEENFEHHIKQGLLILVPGQSRPHKRTVHTYFSITLIYKWTSLFNGSDHCHALVVYSLILDHFKCYWVLNVVTLVDKDASCQLLIQQNRSTLGSVVSL